MGSGRGLERTVVVLHYSLSRIAVNHALICQGVVSAYRLRSATSFDLKTHHPISLSLIVTGPGPIALALLESSRCTDVDEQKQGWMPTNLHVCT